jgi:FkbM family methyltransferase
MNLLGTQRQRINQDRLFTFIIKYKHHAQTLGIMRGAITAAFPAGGSVVRAQWSQSPHPIFLRAGSSDMSVFKEVLLDEEYSFPLAETPHTIIDAGANIGLSAIWFATRYPHARIIAVEAERANFELMVRNLEAYPNVTPVHAALWSHGGVVGIEDPFNVRGWGFQTTQLDDRARSPFGRVRCVTAGDLIEEYGLDRVSLFKIDIEGAEYEVFSDPGSSEWLTSVDAIAIELHDRFRPGCSRAFFSRVGELTIEKTMGANTFVARQHKP